MIIGISAKLQHGKDTVASLIQKLTLEKSEWEIKRFAGKLKQIVSLLTGIPTIELEKEEIKNSSIGKQWGDLTYRKMLQLIGTEAMRDVIHKNIWVNALMSEYVDIQDTPIRSIKYPNWIIVDCRFENEVKAIKDRGGILIRIERPSIISTSNHPSETSLDNYAGFDYTILNDGTLNDLENDVKELLKSIGML